MSIPMQKNEKACTYADYLTWETGGRYGRPEMYSDEEKINVGIFEDLEINLKIAFESLIL